MEERVREIIREMVFRDPRAFMLYLEGLDVNEKMNEGKTMLHVAVSLRDKEIVNALLNVGAHVNILDDDGNSPLSLAIDSGSSDMVELLLNHNPDFDMEIVREKFYSCLLSTFSDYEQIVVLMVRYGFTFKSSDTVSSTILWFCISLGLEDMAISIVQLNSEFTKTIDIWHRSFLLHTQPFTQGQTEILRIIVKIKNLFIENIETKWTGDRNKDLFKILLSEADTELINVNVMSPGGIFDPNDESDIAEIVKDVLLSCYDAHHPVSDDKGRTGLHCAAKVGNIAIIQSLLDMHADINAVDNDGKTPLYYAYDRICELSSEDNTVTSNDEKQFDTEFNCWFTLFDVKVGALVLLKHISKLITLNTYITIGNLKVVKSLLVMMNKDDVILPYYLSVYRLIENCEYEVNLLKKNKIAGLSYFDFLTKDCDKIAFCTKRYEVFETFQLNDNILKEFEIYGLMLQHQFQICNLRRNLIEKAEIILFDILKWLQIPIVVVREILCNFSNNDLFFLILKTY